MTFPILNLFTNKEKKYICLENIKIFQTENGARAMIIIKNK